MLPVVPACAEAPATVSAPPNCEIAAPEGANTLTTDEHADGWRLLWDGETADGWRSARSESFPAKGWTMCNGVLTVAGDSGEESHGGGDIITRRRFSDFELSFDFRLTPGANSGVKIFAQTDISPIDRITSKPTPIGSGIGMEFQVLDDTRHPDAKMGRDGNRTLGSFYDVIPAATPKAERPIGEWNHGHIVSRGGRVTYYLNGRQTVDFVRGSPEFAAAVAESKFKNITGFGEWEDGHILLQDHGDTVSFTNLKIRELPRGS
jgi:hypothetical protein